MEKCKCGHLLQEHIIESVSTWECNFCACKDYEEERRH